MYMINSVFCADPHIKVTGTKEAVAEAKEKILNILNTKVQHNSCYCLKVLDWYKLLFATPLGQALHVLIAQIL